MERRSEARTEIGPWLEHLAWNAAALAALAVMLLVLLGSLEWLDAVAEPPSTATAAAKAAERARSGAGRRGKMPVVAGGEIGAGEACAPRSGGSG
jgi:hypothetical protein